MERAPFSAAISALGAGERSASVAGSRRLAGAPEAAQVVDLLLGDHFPQRPQQAADLRGVSGRKA